MVNKNELIGKIRAAGYTNKALAKAINMNKNTLSNKINGNTKFNTDEITMICNILKNMSDKEKVKIFLN